MREILRGADGPPRMFSPLVTRGGARRGDAPLAVYLPGLDGTGFSAASQFEYIADEFNLIALNVPAGDRGDVFDLVKATTAYLDTHVAAARANGLRGAAETLPASCGAPDGVALGPTPKAL